MIHRDIENALHPLGLSVLNVEQKFERESPFDEVVLEIDCLVTGHVTASEADKRYTPSRILKSGNRTIVF